MFHRCRWHPANHSLVLQRPARRRSSVCSTCSPHCLAEAKHCLLAFQLPSSTEAPSKNLPAKNQACAILPASSPKCAHRPARTLKALQRRCRLAALCHLRAGNTLALDCSPCRTADPLGVCDVKDRLGSPPKLLSQVTMNRYQPRTPGAAPFYCMTRANFAIQTRTAFGYFLNEKSISHSDLSTHTRTAVHRECLATKMPYFSSLSD